MKKLIVIITITLLIVLSTACSNETPNWDLPVATLPIAIEIIETTEQEQTTIDETEKLTLPVHSVEEIETEIETEIEDITTEELTTEEETTEELTTEAPTTEEPTTEEPTTEEPTKPVIYTFTDTGYVMYAVTAVNVRDLPTATGNIISVLSTNAEVWVTGRCNETGWLRIAFGDGCAYVCNDYFSSERVQVAGNRPNVPHTGSFVYYTVSGRYPEYKYEEYLYYCLKNLGIEWWYPWAVAQIWLESCWSPTSYNGVDAGICQFNESTFSSRAAHHANYPNANIWDPYDSLYVYSFYIRDILAYCNGDVDAALSYYIKGHWNDRHDAYVNRVYSLYNSLQAQ